MLGMVVKEALHVFRGPVQHNEDVIIARVPGRVKQFSGLLLIEGAAPIPKPVQCVPERFPPLLIPCAVSPSRIAPTVAVPAFHSVSATPGTVLDDLSFVGGRKFLQILTIVRKFR